MGTLEPALIRSRTRPGRVVPEYIVLAVATLPVRGGHLVEELS